MQKIKSIIVGMPKFVKIIIIVGLLAASYFGYKKYKSSNTTVTYKTATVEKGNLISSISATGTVVSSGIVNITTSGSGTIQSVYVKEGDTVKKDQKIATLSLDEYGIARQSNAYIDYLKAKEDVVKAEKSKNDLDQTIWEDKKAIIDAQAAVDNVNLHPDSYTAEQKEITQKMLTVSRNKFDVDASSYQNADATIVNARIKVTAAWKDYQVASGTIYAPASGVVRNLALSIGQVIENTTTVSSTGGVSTSSTKTVGVIKNEEAVYQAKVNLTEIDVTKVKPGQKVTMTLTAYPGKSFTGKVLAVDVAGTSTSGVTTYPVTIVFDEVKEEIYTNMAVTAEIITNIKTDVLIVPSTAVKKVNGESTVSILEGKTPKVVKVTVGTSSASEVEVDSGVKEGDTVVTGSSSSSTSKNSTSTQSVFSLGNNRSFGGVTRIQGR